MFAGSLADVDAAGLGEVALGESAGDRHVPAPTARARGRASPPGRPPGAEAHRAVPVADERDRLLSRHAFAAGEPVDPVAMIAAAEAMEVVGVELERRRIVAGMERALVLWSAVSGTETRSNSGGDVVSGDVVLEDRSGGSDLARPERRRWPASARRLRLDQASRGASGCYRLSDAGVSSSGGSR